MIIADVERQNNYLPVSPRATKPLMFLAYFVGRGRKGYTSQMFYNKNILPRLSKLGDLYEPVYSSGPDQGLINLIKQT